MRYRPLLVLALLFCLPAGVWAESGPTLSLSSTATGKGVIVTFSGEGYSPGAEVHLVLGDAGVFHHTTRADNAGRISGGFRLPAASEVGAAGGAVPVRAIELESGKESNLVTLHYEAEALVDRPPAPTMVELSVRLSAPSRVGGDTSYWILYGPPDSEPAVRRLTDPESDGSYSFSTEIPRSEPLQVTVVRGNGAWVTSTGPVPGPPVVEIRDFSTMTFGEDTLLLARYTEPERTVIGELGTVGMRESSLVPEAWTVPAVHGAPR